MASPAPAAEIAGPPVPVAAPVGDELIPNLNLYVRSKLSRSQVGTDAGDRWGRPLSQALTRLRRPHAGPQFCGLRQGAG
jgi:hypothetical protein